jgi:hypothetical protein
MGIIKVDNIEERVTGTGVSIDGVLLKDSKVSNLSDPTASSDAANKGWVEAQGYADIGLIIALG